MRIHADDLREQDFGLGPSLRSRQRPSRHSDGLMSVIPSYVSCANRRQRACSISNRLRFLAPSFPARRADTKAPIPRALSFFLSRFSSPTPTPPPHHSSFTSIP